MGTGEPLPFRGFDASKPSIARIYDYWLGGKDNFAADREVAERITQLVPGVARVCQDNRRFVINAVTWAAGQGVDQFLDLGAGLPTHPAVHEAAREVIPDARVCYVDNDPVAVRHAEAMLAKPDGIAAVEADLTDPDAVWNHPEVRAVVDPSRPVCVILAGMLYFLDLKAAREVAAEYFSRLVRGSAGVISVYHDDDQRRWDEGRDAYTAATVYNHSRDEIESFFAGLELVPPGLAFAHAWRGGMVQVPQQPPDASYMLGGVGIKP
jgi:O-methyltransferase involved in polyketide biosynthesis